MFWQKNIHSILKSFLFVTTSTFVYMFGLIILANVVMVQAAPNGFSGCSPFKPDSEGWFYNNNGMPVCGGENSSYCASELNVCSGTDHLSLPSDASVCLELNSEIQYVSGSPTACVLHPRVMWDCGNTCSMPPHGSCTISAGWDARGYTVVQRGGTTYDKFIAPSQSELYSGDRDLCGDSNCPAGYACVAYFNGGLFGSTPDPGQSYSGLCVMSPACGSPTTPAGSPTNGPCNVLYPNSSALGGVACYEEDAVCFQPTSGQAGACKRCAVPVGGGAGNVAIEGNRAGDDCSGDRSCCSKDDDLVCNSISKKCDPMPELNKCSNGKLQPGELCWNDGWPPARNFCNLCPGGNNASHIKKVTRPDGSTDSFCTGALENEACVTSQNGCECSQSPTSLTCDTSEKCVRETACAHDNAPCTPGTGSGTHCCAYNDAGNAPLTCTKTSSGLCNEGCTYNPDTCPNPCTYACKAGDPCLPEGSNCISNPLGCCPSNSAGEPLGCFPEVGASGPPALKCLTTSVGLCAVPCTSPNTCGGTCGELGYCSADGCCVPGNLDCLGDLIDSLAYTGPRITQLQEFLATLYKLLSPIALGLGVFFVLRSGYKLMTSEGNPQITKEAQEELTSSVLGILFILASVVVLRVIFTSIFGITTGF